MKELNYIDLFAGAGGLSEGFIRAGFKPISHVEMNKDACDTIKTRTAYHWLKENKKTRIYNDYLKSETKNKEELLEKVRFYINHEKEREMIAQSGFDTCLKHYTTKAAYEKIFGYLGL